MPKLFIISGPSGVGKTSLLKTVLAELDNVELSISYTTRQARQGEKDNQDYHFINEEEFTRLREANEFLEWASVFGYYYATSKSEVQKNLDMGKNVILEIDCQGAKQVKQQSDCVSVMIVPPSESVLRERLEARGQDDSDTIRRRLEQAQDELSQASDFDFIIVNQDFNKAATDLKHILSDL